MTQPAVRYSLGIDPDLHATGLVVLSSDPGGKPGILMACTLRVSKTLKGCAAARMMASEIAHFFRGRFATQILLTVAVVEGQRLYPGAKSHQRPEDILHLGQVAGAALASIWGFGPPACEVHFPTPNRWKGSVPKDIHQARTMSKIDDPQGLLAGIPKTHLTHVIDAAGLALWGLSQ